MMKFKTDMICSVDPQNKLKQDIGGVYAVRLIKKVKKRPFRNSIWLCEEITDVSPVKNVKVKENLLAPANMSLLRFNIDAPVVNTRDISSLSKIIKLLDRDYCLTHTTKDDLNNVKALLEKLKFYESMRNV